MYGMSLDTVSQNDIHRYYLDEQNQTDHLNDIKEFSGVHEIVLISTPYKNEYYLHVDETVFRHGDLLRYLSKYTNKSLKEIILETYSKFNEDVIYHLLMETSGLSTTSGDIVNGLRNTEEALFRSMELQTIGTVLSELFKKAVEYVLTIQADSVIAPIRENEISNVLNSIHSSVSTMKNKKFVLVGQNNQSVFLAKHLLLSGAQSVTICTEDSYYEQQVYKYIEHCGVIPVINDVLKNLHVKELAEASYRISSADVIVTLTEHFESLYSDKIIKYIDNNRLTKKKQQVINMKAEILDGIYLDNTFIEELNDSLKRNHSYTKEQLEQAKTFLDESLENETKKFMEIYSTVNGDTGK